MQPTLLHQGQPRPYLGFRPRPYLGFRPHSWKQSHNSCPPASEALGHREGGQPSASPSLARSRCWRPLAAAASPPAH